MQLLCIQITLFYKHRTEKTVKTTQEQSETCTRIPNKLLLLLLEKKKFSGTSKRSPKKEFKSFSFTFYTQNLESIERNV